MGDEVHGHITPRLTGYQQRLQYSCMQAIRALVPLAWGAHLNPFSNVSVHFVSVILALDEPGGGVPAFVTCKRTWMHGFKCLLSYVGDIRKDQPALMEVEPCLMSETVLVLYKPRVNGIRINNSYLQGMGASQNMLKPGRYIC